MRRLKRLGCLFLVTALLFTLIPLLPFLEDSDVYAFEYSSFINDSRWKNGVSWGSGQRPKTAPSAQWWGCAAYAYDFAKVVFGKSNPRAGTRFTNVSQIRAGDVLTVGNQSDGTGHWFCVLKRDGNKLYTAEGNYSSRVRIGWNYTISGSKFKEDKRAFNCGYHFAPAQTTKYYLDVNGRVSGSDVGNLSGVATFDMYINGKAVATGVTDYYQQVDAGSKYEIRNIKPTAAYAYAGVSAGSLSGTVNAATSVRLSFNTAQYTLYAYPNYSGMNYISHTDFTSSAYLSSDTSDTSAVIITRDTAVSLVAVDAATTHNGHNSLKITNYSAGASGKDLAIRTNTQGSKTYNLYGGDERPMILSFYAKASNPGTTMNFRWGYEGVDSYRPVTLTTDWAYYTVRMDKIADCGQYFHPYIDRAGTVWISELQLEDGSSASAFKVETGEAELATAYYGSAYPFPAAPTRAGYLFDGWYTQAVGGTQVTSLTAYHHDAIYAHWKVKPAEKINLANATVAGLKDKTYTGKAITQAITVTLNGKTLQAGTDYTVTYQNNVKVGTATVIITGKGKYTGTVKKAFQIKKAATPAKPSYVRISGADRYATSLEIAAAYKKALGVSQFSAVCVADGVNFPDALAGAYFASVNKAPIIAVRQNAPTGQQTMNSINYIKKNLKKGGTVYILGGPGSVPASVANTLKNAGFKVQRLWGQNRYLSNIEILKAAKVKAGSEFIVTTGTAFADALSASATGKPVLLVTGNALTKEQKAYLAKAQAKKFTIVGTTKDVSAGIEKQLKQYGSVSRISAKTAYERSVAVAKKYFPGTRTHINIADGRKFPDALCAGPLAIKKGGPLILTNGSSVVDYPILTYAKAAKTMKATVYGGPASVSDASARYILGID